MFIFKSDVLKVHKTLVQPQRLSKPVDCRACAKPGNERLLSRIRTANEVLEEVGAILQQQILETRTISINQVDSQLKELWARQDAIWQRETRRWEQDRTSWDSREAALLAHIDKLQDKIVELATQIPSRQPQSSNLLHNTAPEAFERGNVCDGQEVTDSMASTNLAQGLLATSSVIEEASQFWPTEDMNYRQPDPAEFEPLSDTSDANASAKERIRNSLKEAFRAVTHNDVLEADFDVVSPTSGNSASAPELSSYGISEGESDLPFLKLGSDDIFWVSQLHSGLLKVSLYPGEEDMEDWYFGEQTQKAVLTFQATVGLPQTGIVDTATWRQLLGSNYHKVIHPREAKVTRIPRMEQEDTVGTELESISGKPQAMTVKSDQQSQIHMLREISEMENRRRNEYSGEDPRPAAIEKLHLWPVLREGDGGRNVHHLQVALERKGFIADEEDQRWWWFGSSTQECVMTFQACSGLPESGVVDPAVWSHLLGAKATPDSLTELCNDFETDLTDNSESVWLLGEQRWARPKK